MKIKRYENTVNIGSMLKNKHEDNVTFNITTDMTENEYGEYISVYDLPRWVRFILGIKDNKD